MASIKDVAKLADVSIGSVSKYLNGGKLKANEYCEQFEPLMRSMEPSIALIRAAKCERESQ